MEFYGVLKTIQDPEGTWAPQGAGTETTLVPSSSLPMHGPNSDPLEEHTGANAHFSGSNSRKHSQSVEYGTHVSSKLLHFLICNDHV